MERMLASNLDTLEQFLQNKDSSNQRQTKGFLMNVFGFCFDAFTQIINSNQNLKYELKGFLNLKTFLDKYPSRDIDNIEFDEFVSVARALIADRAELDEFFKMTKRTRNAKYEIF